MKKKEILVYTDGSSLGNPGEGGWGIIFLTDKKVFEMGGYFKDVTNNQMELWALKKALEFMVEKNIQNYKIIFRIDSKYTIDGVTKWIYSWVKNNWKKSDKKSVLNKEIWEEIFNAKGILETENELIFEHVPAHKGEEYNERVDDIARGFAEKRDVELYRGRKDDYFV